jgi:superfamily II DNA or RNA helicase
VTVSTPRRSEVVRIRDERWTVTEAIPFVDATVIAVVGCDRCNRGQRARYLLPFEACERIPSISTARVVSRRRWRHLARAVLAHTTPAFDSLRAAASADVAILPYQLEPALALVSGEAARILIADEVGLGKTVQAGLMISETLARRADAHVLVLCPAGLREQWRDELSRRFRLAASVLDSAAFRRLPLVEGANPWAVHPLILTSMDYIKRPEVIRALEPVVWDLLVVDEAHSIAGASDRHDAAALLARQARAVVMLSATPHSGDPTTFARLSSTGDLDDSFPLRIFRRTRADVSVAGSRRTRWLRVQLADAEVQLHRALMAYVRRVWRRPASSGARLAMVILTRRACSSAASLARTLERRLALLDALPGQDGQLDLPWPLCPEGDDEPGGAVGAAGLEDRATERQTIETILALARRAADSESKPGCLSRLLRRCSEPAIVFTEYRDTLGSLEERIPRFDTCVLHGGLTAGERARAIREFTSGARRVLLATDAASEGLNLQQRCRLVIHLEVPWTPTRIEQRVGRVDRIGQQRVVHQLHLVARDTVEETRVAALARRQLQISSSFNRLAESPPSERETAGYVICGDPLPACTSALLSVSAGEAGARAWAEARRLLTVRQLQPSASACGITADSPECVTGTAAQSRPFATTRRRSPSAVGWWALWLEWTDTDGHLEWETLAGIMASHRWDRHRSRRGIRRVVDASWTHIREEAAAELRALALLASRSMRASSSLALAREQAIARDVARRHARIAADLLQPGLFDRRAERLATAQRAVVDRALTQCQQRMAELERRRDTVVPAVRPAFSLIAW